MDFKNFHNFSLVRKGSRFEVRREKQLTIFFKPQRTQRVTQRAQRKISSQKS
jgi:hypothetical protein